MKGTMAGIAIMFALAAAGQDTTGNTEVAGGNPFTFSGFIETYYTYDFNQPENHQRPGFFYSHNRHNEFNINLAYAKGSYSAERLRANLALGVGTYMNANYAAEPGVLKNLYEANIGYQLLTGKHLWLDIGIMPSHIGFESAHSPSCWTLTRSMAADNSPYYESGARLGYTTANGQLSLSLLVLNGWQRITRLEGNSLMSWGTQVYYKPSEQVLLNYSTFLGSDTPDSTRRWRYFHNLYSILQLTPAVGVILGLDYGLQQKSRGGRGGKSQWYTPVVLLRLSPGDHWSFALRGEYYSDEEGVIIATGTPNGFRTTGFSANADYRPAKNAVLRLEGRTLRSKDPIFNQNGTPGHTNTFLAFSIAVTL